MDRSFRSVLAALVFAAALLSGCSGGTSGTTPAAAAAGAASAPNPTATPTAGPLVLLMPGSTYRYTGTETQAITFASPSATTPNSNAAYTLTETDTVSRAGSNAPAPYEVRRVLHFTTTTPASYGIAPISETRDDYENVIVPSEATQSITLAETHDTQTGTDVTSVLANGGSGAFSQTTKLVYAPQQVQARYPLIPGDGITQTVGRTETASASVATGSGSETSATTTTYAGNGAYSRSGTLLDGDSTTAAEAGNGSGTLTDTGPDPLTEKIGAPVLGTTAYTIPVTLNGQSYAIPDYYPGNASASPLEAAGLSIIGPASLVFSACPQAASYPFVNEIDDANNTLDALAGTYTMVDRVDLDSNGLRICDETTTTETHYSLTTGLQTELDLTIVVTRIAGTP
jgi:hypothetical protein